MRKRRPDWITQELVGQVTKKKRLWIVCMRQGDMVSERTYKKQETKVKKNGKECKEKNKEEVGKR